jgi:hypothetical protein
MSGITDDLPCGAIVGAAEIVELCEPSFRLDLSQTVRGLNSRRENESKPGNETAEAAGGWSSKRPLRPFSDGANIPGDPLAEHPIKTAVWWSVCGLTRIIINLFNKFK